MERMRPHQPQQPFTHPPQKVRKHFRFVRCGLVGFFVFVGLALLGTERADAQKLLIGREFDTKLKRRLTGGPITQSLTEFARRFGTDYGIAVVIDRRTDPNKPVTLKFSNSPIPDVLRLAAEQGGADISLLDNVIVLGPKNSISKLSTLVRLRQKELTKFRAARALKGMQDVTWPMLAEPQSLVTRLAERHKIRIENPEVIPHDLWAAATLPSTDGVTALSVILIQFGMTFEYLDGGKSIRLVPVPDSVVVEERVRITRKAPENLLEIARQQFPRATIRRSGNYLKVKSTVEEIEAIRKLALGEPPSQPSAGPGELKDQRFTLTVSGASARQILDALKKKGTPVDWDEAALKTAGIDLNKQITIDEKNATVDRFFKSLCDQVSLNFRVEERRVVLFPKP